MTPIIELATYPGLDPRIVILRAGDEVDAVFVRAERFDVLIDTLSTPEDCRAALDLVDAHFGTARAERPMMVVNSHMDWDHFWGNAIVAGRHPIIAHAEALMRLADPSAAATLAESIAEDRRFSLVSIVPPDLTFSGSMTLYGGDLSFELIHTPGHTPDHMSVWIPKLRTCLAVDAVEWPIPEVWSEKADDLRELRASLRRIQNLDATFVITAHGRNYLPALVADNIAYFDALERFVGERGTEELEAADMAARPGHRLEDLVALPGDMPSEMRAYYERSHRANLAAAIVAGRNGISVK